MSARAALIGASGAGKSTVGALLAQRWGCPLIDVDAEVEREAGVNIATIFEREGEAGFRAREASATVDALNGDAVVSLGGGAPMTPAVADALRACPLVVWLRVAAPDAAARVGRDPLRPLLAGDDVEATLRTMLKRREPTYAALATLTIDTHGLSAEQVADAIDEALASAHPVASQPTASPARGARA